MGGRVVAQAGSPTKADVIARICEALAANDVPQAKEIANAEYPFKPGTAASRKYSKRQQLELFRRDCFIDRYSGQKLLFPGALRLLYRLLPDQFPLHANWKMTGTHMAWWELFPTPDHVSPAARGGTDDLENWITTSMLRNAAKAHWTLEELGWPPPSPPPSGSWDGLMRWTLDFCDAHPEHLSDRYLFGWYRAARSLLKQDRAP